jgi:diacylglycerol kinase family enzyme
MLAVANGRYFGGGMEIAPEAKLDSGHFDIIILRATPKMRLIRDMPLVYRGAHMDHPMILARRGRKISSEAADPAAGRIPVDIDGESPGFLGAEFEILPGALMLRG